MTTMQQHTGVDMRGFHWPLLPLQRKASWDLAAAQARLAGAIARLLQAQRDASRSQSVRDEQMALATVAPGGRLDARSRMHALRYLRDLASTVDADAREVLACERVVDAARANCAACKRRLEGLDAARTAAERGYVRGAILRQDRLADAAWLAHAQAGRTTTRWGA